MSPDIQKLVDNHREWATYERRFGPSMKADYIDQAADLITRLAGALEHAHEPALSTRGYPTSQSEAVREFCQQSMREAT